MFNIDLVQVTILWSIAGLGAICALNARGFIRQVISWIIVVAIATCATGFSFLKFESVKQEVGLSPQKNNQSILATSSSSAEETDSYSSTEKQLAESLKAISDSILSFPNWKDIYSQGIERREIYESKALSLRNRSMNFYRQIRNITPPEAKKQSYDLLLTAADNLRLAGYEVHYQFALEADSLGESISNAYKRASYAKSTISSIVE